MDADKKRILLEDLTDAERAILAKEALEKQPEETNSPLKEFRSHMPSAIEGGGRPSEVSFKTQREIANVSEGQMDSVNIKVPDSEVRGSEEAEAFKHLEEGSPFSDHKGGLFAYNLTKFLESLGEKKKE